MNQINAHANIAQPFFTHRQCLNMKQFRSIKIFLFRNLEKTRLVKICTNIYN
jgi:hypothetical protein